MTAPGQAPQIARRWDPLIDTEQPLMKRPANTHRHGLLDQIDPRTDPAEDAAETEPAPTGRR